MTSPQIMKSSARHKLFWTSAIFAALFAMAYLIVPPMLPMTHLRDSFAGAVSKFAGRPVSVGDVKLSLLGHPMIALTNVNVGDIAINSLRFRISWAGLFDLKNADITGSVRIEGAKITVSSLGMPDFGRRLIIVDSVVDYGGKNYEIMDGILDLGRLTAHVRTDQHKYMLDISRGSFKITNSNENLEISGRLIESSDGAMSAEGALAIDSLNLNEWFDFKYPKVSGRAKLSMNFLWDGRGYFDFSKINGTVGKSSISGRIRLWHENGRQVHKSVRLRLDNTDLDLSFLTANRDYLSNSDFNITAGGRIKTTLPGFENLSALSVKMSSMNESDIDLQTLKFSNADISVSAAGNIRNGAANKFDLSFYRFAESQSVRCVLDGTPDAWECSSWSLVSGGISAAGTLSVWKDGFKMTVESDGMSADLGMLDTAVGYVGSRVGDIYFKIGSMEGRARISGASRHVEFVQKDVELGTLPVALPLPKSMLTTRGNIAAKIVGRQMSFVFKTMDWSFSTDDQDGFMITHNDARAFLSELTGRRRLPFLRKKLPVVITGRYMAPLITDLRIKIGNMVLTGSKSGHAITLKTDLLDIDDILDDEWFDKFEDNQYLSGDPLLSPFDFGIELAITANIVKMGGEKYAGFLYSLDKAAQRISVSDSENGKMLLSIDRSGSRYKYLAQLNKFFVRGKIFGGHSPVNIEDSIVTARAELESNGLTAHDIRRNMSGTIDISFDGGVMDGLGTDGFYAGANRYGRLDAEDALSNALSGGRTRVKEMQITGEYSGGDFRTTKPFFLAVRHVDITGNFSLRGDNIPLIRANVLLRGTAPVPKPVAVLIDRRGRAYSLTDILRDLDLDYMREFVSSHNKF